MGTFVAQQQVEAGFGGHVVKGPGQAVIGSGVAVEVFEGAVYVFGDAVHFVGEDAGLNGGDAAETPAGGGHGFDQFGFEEAGGGEFVQVGAEESLVVFGGLRGEDDGDGRERGGGESMA